MKKTPKNKQSWSWPLTMLDRIPPKLGWIRQGPKIDLVLEVYQLVWLQPSFKPWFRWGWVVVLSPQVSSARWTPPSQRKQDPCTVRHPTPSDEKVVPKFLKTKLIIPKKQDEAHEPECRHVCWRTETILIRFSSEPTCGTPWRDTLRWHSCRTPFLLDTLTWHSCKTLLLDTLLVKDTLTWHFLLDIL